MQPANQGLIQAYTTFASEINLHRAVFVHALANQATVTGIDLSLQLYAGWYGLVGLHDAWGRFCKQAIILSAQGGVVTRSGTLLAPSPVLTPGINLLTYLKQQWPRNGYGACQKDGPAWYVPTIADQAAQILQITNQATFSGGILSGANEPIELKACRNYLAHRHPGTQAHLDIITLRHRLQVGHSVPLTEHLALEIVQGNITVFEEWCIDLDSRAAASIA